MSNKNVVVSEEEIKKALTANNKVAYEAIQDEDKFERLIQRLEKKLELIPGIGKYLSDIACMVSLVKNYIKKEYTDVPLGTIISIVSALIYIVSPVDIIPDILPGIGYIDDIALIALVLKLIHSDVEEFKQWRVVNNKQIIYSV